MIRSFTMRALAARRRRAFGAACLVAVGVALVTGALVFTASTRGAYRSVFGSSDQGASIVVSPRQQIVTGQLPAPSVPVAYVTRIRALPGVVAAAGQITAPVTIVGRSGAPLRTRVAPIGLSAVPAPFTGVRYVAGAAPSAPDDVAVDAQTAASQGWRVGDRVTLVTEQPAARFTITGIAQLGARRNAAQPFVVFTPAAAQALFDASADVSQVDVATAAGTNLTELAGLIDQTLPPGLVARPTVDAVTEDVQRVATSFGALDAALLAFAIVAAIAGALIIFGTFATTAGQRAAELALLRTLGATRLQVARSALLEALIVGGAGTIVGLVAGPLVALGLRAALRAAGVYLPAASLVLSAGAGAAGAACGVGVTLLAAVVPVVRGAAASPIAALRGVAGARRSRRRALAAGLVRLILAAALVAGGLIVVLRATGDLHARERACAIGGALLLVGLLIAGRALVVAAAGALGAVSRLPVRRRRRSAVAQLARAQTLREPGRAALSASSLTIGLALSLLIAVFVTGLHAATRDAVRQTVVGDIALESRDGRSPIPAVAVRAAVAVPDVAGISALETTSGLLGRAGTVQVSGIDPTSWGSVYRFDWLAGGTRSLTGLQPGQALVESDTAQADGLRLGSSATLVLPDGTRARFTVAGIYHDAGLLHGIAISTQWYGQLVSGAQLQAVFLKLNGAVGEGVALTALRAALTMFPGVVARDQEQLAARLSARSQGVVDLLDALLALSVIMSLLGIGGALSLAVRARLPELGILRALGMTAAQTRRMVLRESVFTAVVGGVCGIALGLGLGAATMHALRPDGYLFQLPWAVLGAVVGADLLAGVLAAIGPARAATRLDVLAAIAHD